MQNADRVAYLKYVFYGYYNHSVCVIVAMIDKYNKIYDKPLYEKV